MQLRVVAHPPLPLVSAGSVLLAELAGGLSVVTTQAEPHRLVRIPLGPGGRAWREPQALPLESLQALTVCNDRLTIAGVADDGSSTLVAIAEAGAAVVHRGEHPWRGPLLSLSLVCAAGKVEAIWQTQAQPSIVWWARLPGGEAVQAVETASLADIALLGDEHGVLLAARDSTGAALIRLVDGAPVRRAAVGEGHGHDVAVARAGAEYVVAWSDSSWRTIEWQWFDQALTALGPAAAAATSDGDERVEAPRFLSGATGLALVYGRVQQTSAWASRDEDDRTEPIEERVPSIAVVDGAARLLGPALSIAGPLLAGGWMAGQLVVIHGSGPTVSVLAVDSPRGR